MIPLKKYITSSYDNRLNEELSILEKHFKLEFEINEALTYSYLRIDEKYGAYDGQTDLVIELAKTLSEDIKAAGEEVDSEDFRIRYKIEKKDLEEYFANVFYDELIIKCYYSDVSGYQFESSNYNENTKTFDKVIIILNILECIDNYENIVSILTHELLHAWEKYSRCVSKSKISLEDLLGDKYEESITINKSDSTLEKACKAMIYITNSAETNAYMSELATLLDKQETIIRSYDEALKLFKKTTTYKYYFGYYNYLNNKIDDKEKFAEIYNRLSDTNYTFNKIYKILNNKFEKSINKILSRIPKIYYEYYLKHKEKELKETRSRQPEVLLEFSNYMNNYKSIFNK